MIQPGRAASGRDELRRMARWTAMQFEYDLVVTVPVITTGDMAANSAVITNIPTTAALAANYFMVSGEGVPPAARVLSVDGTSQVTMTMQNTNTSAVTGVELTFSKDTYPVPSGIKVGQMVTSGGSEFSRPSIGYGRRQPRLHSRCSWCLST